MSFDLQRDAFEQPLAAAHRLMRQNRGEDACQLLAHARDRASADGDSTEACLFASVRGSYLAAMDRNHDALAAYQEAEKLSAGDPHQKLTTARHLLHGMSRPADALEKVDEVLESERNTVAIRQECRAIRGLSLLALGRSEKAAAALIAMSAELSSTQLPSLSCDLTLVEELVRSRLAVSECRAYLELVKSRAANDGDDRTLDRVGALNALFR